MNSVRWILRGSVAAVLAFSGLVKLNDPLGLAYKLEEYWAVFESDTGWHFSALVPLAVPLASLLIGLELLLAVALLTMGKYTRKWTLYSLLALMLFFTWLTFYSAFFEKVTDCGCFGEALPLTPWTSFAKDIGLLAAVSLLCIGSRHLNPIGGAQSTLWGELKWLVVPVLVTTLGATHVLSHLPWKDFSAYAVGADIPRLMQPSAPIQYIYVMEKEGTTHQFAQYPKDTSFHFVDMRIANPEALPKVTDYRIWQNGEDQTLASLEGRKLLLVVQKVQPLARARIRTRLTQGVLGSLGHVDEVWSVASVQKAQYEQTVADAPALRALPFHLADATLLKTLLRSQTGWILLDEGIIRGKWNSRDTDTMLKELRNGL